MRKSLFVETVRMLIVLACTAAGYGIGLHYGAPLYATVLGSAIGYVGGGVLGRLLRSIVGEVEAQAAQMSAGEFLAGAFGALLFGALGALLGVAATGLIPGAVGWLLFAIMVWTAAHTGFRIASTKSDAMLSLAGLSAGTWRRKELQDAVLLDTNVLVDGQRLLRVAKTGFLHPTLIVPTFVLQELQALADSNDAELRRSGRVGLEALDAMRRDPTIEVHVPDDEIPEIETVDAKLIALASRLSVSLLTNDAPLIRVAELRGVRCLNMNRLANSVRPVRTTGEIVELEITRPGQNDGEGVAYLDDGSMVVVSDAADRIGFETKVRITSSVTSARGRIFFAVLADS